MKDFLKRNFISYLSSADSIYCDIFKGFLMEEIFLWTIFLCYLWNPKLTNQLSCLLGLPIGISLFNFCISNKAPYIQEYCCNSGQKFHIDNFYNFYNFYRQLSNQELNLLKVIWCVTPKTHIKYFLTFRVLTNSQPSKAFIAVLSSIKK